MKEGLNVTLTRAARAVARPRPEPAAQVIGFDFYGVTVRVESDDPTLLDRVQHDFYCFRADSPTPGQQQLSLRLTRRQPDYDSLPSLPASVYTPRNISFTSDDTSYIDYFGRALAVYDRTRNHVDVDGTDLSLLHEIAYLTILSRVSGQLERKGLHRMHALCVGRDGRAAMFMMPSGCGKTTLGLTLLERSGAFELISDDSPLISRSGNVLPFPLRFGVLGNPPTGIPRQYVSYLERMEFAPKYLISMAAFEDRIARGEWRPELVFLGDRNLGRNCAIRRVGFFKGFRASIRHMIVGIGLYQGLEFMLRSSLLDLIRSTGVVLSRAIAAARALSKASVYQLSLGRDPETNAAVITAFLDAELSQRPALSRRHG